MVFRLSWGHWAFCYGTRAFGSSVFAGLVALGLSSACAAKAVASKEPIPAWAGSVEAQREARTIESAWHDGSPSERLATEPLLRRFVREYERDPLVNAMRLRLAWLELEQRHYDAAERWIREVLPRVSGVDADMAQVLMAAILGRRGQPVVALAHLKAIGSRLVDPDLRDLWAREAVRIAFLAHDSDEAVTAMLVWRTNASDERQESTEQEIKAYVERLDESSRLRALERLKLLAAQPTAEESRHRARIWMLEAIRNSLGSLAVRMANGQLARRLLADAPTRFLRSPDGEQLRRLAQSLEVQENAMHAAIGLLLELDSDSASHQSAELVTGAMRALAVAGKDESVRLVTRELRTLEPDAVEQALASLATDGAAILVAGLTPPTATLAARVAQSRQIAIVLLAEPDVAMTGNPYVYFVQSPDAQVERLFREAASESRRIVRLLPDDAFCRPEERLGWVPEFLGSRGDVLVTADASCAQRLADQLRVKNSGLRVWLGPQAAGVADAFDEVSIITSSQFLESAKSVPVAAWRERFQRLPSWYEALGYDVTRLGMEAIQRRGTDTLRGEALVRQARAQIGKALGTVECDLMITSARGFGGKRSLEPSMIAERRRTRPRQFNGTEKPGS